MNRISLILIFCLFSNTLHGDEWPEPSIKRYFSLNGQFMLKVIPTKISSKYYKWLNAKPKSKSKFAPSDTTIVHCHATFYKIENSDTLELWTKKLINPIMPMQVIIANDGKSFVTFDNWSSLGYGFDVMVTYDENGGLVKRYQLEDFSPFPINSYELSVSSIWWRCGSVYLDNQTIEICFQDENKNVKKRKYNLTIKEFE
jgi:hypothetical protein